MQKSKLTLYVEEEISRLAHKAAKRTGKSISVMVKEYFIQQEKRGKTLPVSPAVQQWIGILKTGKSYKRLRDDHFGDLLKKHENLP